MLIQTGVQSPNVEFCEFHTDAQPHLQYAVELKMVTSRIPMLGTLTTKNPTSNEILGWLLWENVSDFSQAIRIENKS